MACSCRHDWVSGRAIPFVPSSEQKVCYIYIGSSQLFMRISMPFSEGVAMRRMLVVAGLLLLVAVIPSSGCGGGGGGSEGGSSPIPATQSAYVVVAWNDLGMHCLNPSYDTAVILPPYNTIWAQVIQRGTPPKIVTNGITVEYRIENNTYSYGKRSYGQFWDNVFALFGVSTLAHDTGLNLEDPNIHNGLSGTMVSKPSGTNVIADHFQVNGIPVTPVNDSGAWSPYQVAVITAKDQAGNVLAETRTTVPTSDEIDCGKCHGPSTDPTVVFTDILQKHDSRETTTLSSSKPVLCAKCHGSPALGQGGRGSSGKYLSEAIHSFHATRGAQCYDCHPGASTSCNRSVRHTSANGNCITCHGDISTVGGSITAGRAPWLSEPKCVTCHGGIWDVDTGTVLYRNKPGHGGVYCAGCHGSPHAMVPSNQPTDNYQAMQYQGAAKTLGDCGVCHATSRGGGSNFTEEHVAEGKTSACNICHTGFLNAGNLTNWPHRFEWKAR